MKKSSFFVCFVSCRHRETKDYYFSSKSAHQEAISLENIDHSLFVQEEELRKRNI